MFKKQYTVLILLIFLFATMSAASAACPKVCKTCTGSSCPKVCSTCKTGTTCKNCGSCSGNVCITYVKCSGAEYIKICNNGASSQSLAGWNVGFINNDPVYKTGGKELKRSLPAMNIKPKGCVWVFVKSGQTKGTVGYLGICKSCDIFTCKTGKQIANLYNSKGELVSSKTN